MSLLSFFRCFKWYCVECCDCSNSSNSSDEYESIPSTPNLSKSLNYNYILKLYGNIKLLTYLIHYSNLFYVKLSMNEKTKGDELGECHFGLPTLDIALRQIEIFKELNHLYNVESNCNINFSYELLSLYNS